MDRLTEQIIKHEGLRLRMYKDNATPPRWTIGYGHNIEDNGISKKAADLILADDLAAARHDCTRLSWFEDLDENRQLVIINMVFNMGLPTFKQFKRTIHFLDMGMFPEASEEMLDSKWADQVGTRADELSEIMRTGEWT